MRHRKAVALLIETSNSYARGLLDGIIAWQREHEFWSVYLPEQERGAAPPSWLKNWKGDGMIARVETDEIAAAITRLRLPVVDVSAARRLPGVPWVETNDEAIARLAADHFLKRGFRNFAFCGEPHFNWSRWREEHFVRFVQAAGGCCDVFRAGTQLDRRFSLNRERTRLKIWLRRLPKPVAIMACYDIKGRQILDLCRELDIAVPEQIAVIGVDDDRRLCNLCTPPLSSVIPDTRTTGYESARLLDRMMAGERLPADPILVDPLGIAERLSTDVLAVEDQYVVAALRVIRRHAFEGISVADVLKTVPLSRRSLEARFLKRLGRTPHEEIERLRIDRVKQLLTETDLPLPAIAQRSGYRSSDYLCVVFKRCTQTTPGMFREAHRQVEPRRPRG